jgi:hypothetical protein
MQPHQPHHHAPAYPQPAPPRRPKRVSPAVIVLAVIGGVLTLCLVIGGIGALLTSQEPDGDTADDKLAAADATTAVAPADPGKLDKAGNFACTDFAKGYKSAQTRQARVDLADKVNEWASKSRTDRIADTAAGLGRTAEGSATAWKLAADTFASVCLDAGWSADTAK